MLRDYLELDVLNSFIPEMIFLIFRGPFNTPGAICVLVPECGSTKMLQHHVNRLYLLFHVSELKSIKRRQIISYCF